MFARGIALNYTNIKVGIPCSIYAAFPFPIKKELLISYSLKQIFE
jgi:hypothetical protein